jgi:2-hydroxy-6-oxonona-2,4-dienedioate hydrolase
MPDTPPKALTSTRSRVGDWEIHAVRTAAGQRGRPPVVLVHGWGVAGGYFEPLAERLAPDFPVYVPDLPGHGLSDKPRDPLTLGELADALSAWMQVAGIGPAVVVGQSFGSQIASDLAARHPERVLGLVLIGPTVDARARSIPRQIGRLVLAGLWERVSLVPIVVRDYLRMGLRRLRGELHEMFADAIELRLARIAAPGLVVRGAKDAVAPLRWAREVAALLGDAPVVTIPGGGHAVQFGEPAAVAREIRRFALEIVSGRNSGAGSPVWSTDSSPGLACPLPDPGAPSPPF